jgi:DNA-binding CsgD family transcriptional regulator
MKSVEFYTYNNEVWYRDGEVSERLTEKSEEVISYLMDKLTQFYPFAHQALEREYAGIQNIRYKRFRIVQRFCKCNFGRIDNVHDIDASGNLHFEIVECPLRGECKLEDCVCNPKFNACISESENRVMRLLYQGIKRDDIAEKLYLSPITVKNHIANVLQRLGLHSVQEFMAYANKKNLYKEEE